MKIKIICIGKLQEKFWREAAEEYRKRLSRFCKLEIIELKEAYLSANPGTQAIQGAISHEGEEMLSQINKEDFVISMDLLGSPIDSEELASKLKDWQMLSCKRLIILVGGSHGLSENVKARADYSISLSNLTFPHQLARIIILEQIYRAYMINEGSTYHK